MTVLEDSPQFSLAHDPSCDCLYATWLGPHRAPLTRVNYRLILQHVQATGSTKLLNDSTLDEDGWQEVTDWIAEDCFTSLASAGLHSVAWVLPQHLGALHDTARVLAKIKRPLVDTFVDAEAAYAWLHRWSGQAR